MSKDDRVVFGFGILCLVGGILLAYFGYFAPPYLLLTMGMPVNIAVLFAPLLLIFLGGFIVFAGIIDKLSPKKKTKKVPAQLSVPPPPPASATATVCPACGQPLAFIQQYSRWYCYNCKKYP